LNDVIEVSRLKDWNAAELLPAMAFQRAGRKRLSCLQRFVELAPRVRPA
jgi:hypothetical protein